MKFIALGKYSAEGLNGFVKNPTEDRQQVIAGLMAKAGGSLENLYLTRGEYDIVAIGEAPDFNTIAAIKMLIIATGALSEMIVLEPVDFNQSATIAASLAGTYKAPGK